MDQHEFNSNIKHQASSIKHQDTSSAYSDYVDKFIADTKASELQNIIDKTHRIGPVNRQFEVNILEGDKGIVIIPAEAGNGSSFAQIIRMKFMKSLFPEMSVIYLPAATIFQPKAMNLPKGKNPLDAINESILRAYEQFGKMGRIVLLGNSQAATVVTYFATDWRAPNNTALIATEPTNVVDRSLLELALRFKGNGENTLNYEKNLYFKNTKNDELQSKILKEISPAQIFLFISGLLIPDNMRVFNELRKNTFHRDAEIALKRGATIMHAWAKRGISPVENNRQIAHDLLQKYPNSYASKEYDKRKDDPDQDYDHALTNNLQTTAELTDILKEKANL